MLLVSIPTWGHAAAEGPRARSGRQLRVSGASVRSLTETPTNKEKVRGAVRLSGQTLMDAHDTQLRCEPVNTGRPPCGGYRTTKSR